MQFVQEFAEVRSSLQKALILFTVRYRLTILLSISYKDYLRFNLKPCVAHDMLSSLPELVVGILRSFVGDPQTACKKRPPAEE